MAYRNRQRHLAPPIMRGSFQILALLLTATTVARAEFDFIQKVQPVLEGSCVRCHSAEKKKGGLRLDTKEGFLQGGASGPTVVPGAVEKSELIRRISVPRGHEDLMPQEMEPLSGPHKNWLVEWVKTGAKWPDGVVLKSHKRSVPGLSDFRLIPETAPTSVEEAARVADGILKKENTPVKGKKLLGAALIDDLSFLRRVTVDLVGRIPTTQEVAQFEAEDARTRRSKLVARLISSPRFADRWTVFYADMLRVRSQAEGGSQLLAYINRCVAQGKPYDEMVRELISTNGRAEQAPAAGFALGDMVNPMALAGATVQVFMGVRLACAECHDHPFDDWKQKEFYELAAYFGHSKRVETGKKIKTVYTTEGDEMLVKWPPEREQAPKRDGVEPKFPFEMISFKVKPSYISRLEKMRNPGVDERAVANKALDELVSDADPQKALKASLPGGDVLAESVRDGKKRQVDKSIFRQSEERAQLAAHITDPRNPYFARALVNRVWAELVGRGFVEPLDNFSAYNEIRSPQLLQYLAQEFIASGYDLRSLVKLIVLTETYQKGHLPAGATAQESAQAEEAFTATRPRRMLGEVLFDSVAEAGHVQDFKWPTGANRREVQRQIRIPIAPKEAFAVADDAMTGNEPKMMGGKPAMGSAPYDLEKGQKLDFDALLKEGDTGSLTKNKPAGVMISEGVLSESRMDVEARQKKEDAEVEAVRMARIRALQSGLAERFRLETITEVLDDNPKFDSTFRMASPAPPSHFVRVFGQPSRDNLGEFRNESPSLRQELLMLNGKVTHEASRVGPLEPIFKLVSNPNTKPEQIVEFAYLEALTRRPNREEVAEAVSLMKAAETPVEGLADLRWTLLNSLEFRFIP